MSPPDRPDRIQIAFDDHRPVANADLILPVTLAHQLGLVELVDQHVDLGDGPGVPRQAGTGVSATAIHLLISPIASPAAGQNAFHVADTLSTRTNPSGSTHCCLPPSLPNLS